MKMREMEREKGGASKRDETPERHERDKR